MPDSTPTIRPAFHHVNLKTTRLQEMIDWYSGIVVGAEVNHQDDVGAWLSNDRGQSPHRPARLPGLRRRPEKDNPHRPSSQRL